MDKNIQKIAIDIGYGDTKVMTKDKIFKFPTAITLQKESQSDFTNSSKDVYSFNGFEYIVGEKALADAISTRGFDFILNYSPLIIYHAIKKAGLDTSQPIEITTGLSIINWQHSDELLKTLEIININNEIIEPTIRLMAQGQGIFFDYDGEKNEGDVCIVDIGYNTFDFLVFTNGEPRKDLSFASKIGAHRIITELQNQIQKRFDIEISEQLAKEKFNSGYIEILGERIDLSDEIEKAKIQYTNYIIDELKAKRGDFLKTAKKVIFSGGGAYFLENLEAIKNTKNIDFSKKPYEFSNVRGYYYG